MTILTLFPYTFLVQSYSFFLSYLNDTLVHIAAHVGRVLCTVVPRELFCDFSVLLWQNIREDLKKL